MSHLVEYKGYKIICENGLYYVENRWYEKYVSFDGAKAKVDELEKQENELQKGA